MSMTEEQAQILFDGERGTKIEFEDAKHGLCNVVRGKVGYTLHVVNRKRMPPQKLETGDTQSLTEEIE